VTSTAYIEDESGERATGAYFLSHDSTYLSHHCFHIVIYNLLIFLDNIMDIC